MSGEFRRPVDVGATSPNRRKAQLRRAVKLTGNLTLFSVMVLGSFWIWGEIRSHERFSVSVIELAGPDRVDPRIEEIAESCRGRNLFEIDLEELSARFETVDWVEEAAIVKLLPHTLSIEITEREPVAIVIRRGREWWVDEEGAIFEPIAGERSDLPRLETLTRARTAEALAFLGSLERRDPALHDRIVRLTPLAHAQWVVEERELGTRIILSERDVIGKWRSLYGIARTEAWQRGVVEYADLRFDRQIVVRLLGQGEQLERSR